MSAGVMLTLGSLFSGIGGLELGLEMTGGFRTLWQAEKDGYARRVLAQHWPEVTRVEDVRNITAVSVPRVDLICGGFPCQPHSTAGKRQSSADERDLWHEFARIVGEVRPRWVVAENVPGLLSSHDPAHGRGAGGFFGRVLRDLALLGFNAEWHSVPAAAVGAPHLRYRVFLVAYAAQLLRDGGSDHADSDRESTPTVSKFGNRCGPQDVADARSAGREEQHAPAQPGWAGFGGGGSDAVRHTAGEGLPDWAGGQMGQPSPITELERSGGREVERDFRGMAHGVHARVDRLRCLGNAVVPQVAQGIGAAILEAEECRRLTGRFPEQVVQPRHFGLAVPA